MRIIEVIIEAIDHIGANITVGGHTEGPNKGEGDNKIIIEANFKVTVGSLIFLMVAITIITMAIIKVEVAVAVTFIDYIGNYRSNNNYQYHQYYMHDNAMSLNNTVHYALFVEVSIILLNTVLRENMISIILWRK